MPNPWFQFKQFIIHQDRCAMKVTTDACLFGAWAAREILSSQSVITPQGPGKRNMVDIGTGTGLLTLMIAQKNPHLIIDSFEIDENTYVQAKENILASPFKNKFYAWHSDILKEPSMRKYDIVISNPPFYENELKSGNKLKNIAHHDEGLPLEELLPAIKNCLHATSKFYLLLPFKRKKEIELLLDKNSLHPSKIVSVRQSVDRQYFRLMIEGSLFNNYEMEESEIAITKNDGQYTNEFINLLKDYYLYL
jgi:tRNA1Val (adenine37-N6)-methyltransferase